MMAPEPSEHLKFTPAGHCQQESSLKGITLHYYQFNIGDYRRQTSHLTLVEHALYRSLIDTYYLTELPLDKDLKALARAHNARSEDDKEALNNVLSDFFTLVDAGYCHTHCDEQLGKIYNKSELARKSAKARWDKQKNANNMQDGCERNANALNNDANACKTDADGMLPNNPITQDPIPSKNTTSSVDDCPHQLIIDLYHDKLPQLRRIKVWTDKRKKNLRTRWREDKKHQTLEFWERLFDYISRSDFLTGKIGDGNWQANLEWIVNPTNFVKIIEGNYDNE
jgi:uncharacterized protein YdaU (DUF1376 family)